MTKYFCVEKEEESFVYLHVYEFHYNDGVYSTWDYLGNEWVFSESAFHSRFKLALSFATSMCGNEIFILPGNYPYNIGEWVVTNDFPDLPTTITDVDFKTGTVELEDGGFYDMTRFVEIAHHCWI